jgi:hypothetical protein
LSGKKDQLERVKGNEREVVYEKLQQNTIRKEYGSQTLFFLKSRRTLNKVAVVFFYI